MKILQKNWRVYKVNHPTPHFGKAPTHFGIRFRSDRKIEGALRRGNEKNQSRRLRREDGGRYSPGKPPGRAGGRTARAYAAHRLVSDRRARRAAGVTGRRGLAPCEVWQQGRGGAVAATPPRGARFGPRVTLLGGVAGQEIGRRGGRLTGVALSRISVWIPYGAKKATRKWPKSLILWRARLESNQ